MKLMIDSGSQSTACSVDFAKGYATDDTERAKLWDILDQKIEAHGKKIVDVKFHGQANETPVPAQHQGGCVRCCEKCCFDGQIAKIRIRSALHESRPHLLDGKWKLKTTISEDSPTSEAPLYSLDVEVLPPPGEVCESRSTASARIALIVMNDERVEVAGFVRDRGICMGRAPDGERRLIALPGGRRVNVKMSNIKPAGELDTEIVQRRHECSSIEKS